MLHVDVKTYGNIPDADGVQPPVADLPEQPGRRVLRHCGQRRRPDSEDRP